MCAGAKRDNLSLLYHPNDSKPFYSCAISKNRMKTFMQHVTLDNKIIRKERQKDDKLAAVRELWDLFQINLRNYYIPSLNITVNEKLYGYRGYTPERAYMLAKPVKYRVKIFWLCEFANEFALESFLYGEKSDDGRTVELAYKIVSDLTERYYYTNQTVFIDRYFTSNQLIVYLLSEDLTCIETIMQNRRDIPPLMKSTKTCQRYDSRFLWNHANRIMLLAYAPKRNKNVLLMSSEHTSAETDLARGNKKPQVILQYNESKGGVDSRVKDYSYKRKTSRYPLIFLFNMIDVSLLNFFDNAR